MIRVRMYDKHSEKGFVKHAKHDIRNSIQKVNHLMNGTRSRNQTTKRQQARIYFNQTTQTYDECLFWIHHSSHECQQAHDVMTHDQIPV